MTKRIRVRKAGSIFRKIKDVVNKGKNVVDTIKQRVNLALDGPRKSLPPKLRDFLSKYGNITIQSITVARKPVDKIYQQILNGLSLGKYESTKKELGYDNVYHNYLIIKLTNGQNIKVEKNAVVEAKFADSRPLDPNNTVDVSDKGLTLSSLIMTAAGNDPSFWLYSPSDQNCQQFVNSILIKNGIRSRFKGEAQEKLINPQNAEKIIGSLGVLKNVPKVLTTLGGVADRVISGDGIKKNKHKNTLLQQTLMKITKGKGLNMLKF